LDCSTPVGIGITTSSSGRRSLGSFGKILKLRAIPKNESEASALVYETSSCFFHDDCWYHFGWRHQKPNNRNAIFFTIRYAYWACLEKTDTEIVSFIS
jgi:hypothetical protein